VICAPRIGRRSVLKGILGVLGSVLPGCALRRQARRIHRSAYHARSQPHASASCRRCLAEGQMVSLANADSTDTEEAWLYFDNGSRRGLCLEVGEAQESTAVEVRPAAVASGRRSAAPRARPARSTAQLHLVSSPHPHPARLRYRQLVRSLKPGRWWLDFVTVRTACARHLLFAVTDDLLSHLAIEEVLGRTGRPPSPSSTSPESPGRPGS